LITSEKKNPRKTTPKTRSNFESIVWRSAQRLP
jgi:hypothetical protein